MSNHNRNYKRRPNRFSLQMLYNGELIVTTNRYGNKQPAKRDFDASFNEPFNLGNNPFNDKKLIQDGNNNPHPYELGVFENSWEAVDLGDSLTELFRLILRDGTEDYYQDRYNISKNIKDGLKNLNLTKPNGGNNTYTLVIIDNKSPLRDENGSIYDIAYLHTEFDALVQKEKAGNLSKDQKLRLSEVQREIKLYYTKREIFRHSFSADEYSYDGKDFTPPMPLIWKDFNVDYKPLRRKEVKNYQYADISQFNSIRNKVVRLRQLRKKIIRQIEIATEQQNNVKLATLEHNLEEVNGDLHYHSNIYFKGLRSTIKAYFSLEEYTNRFLNAMPRYNNFHAVSSELEIGKSY